MRYYSIKMTDVKTGKDIIPASLGKKPLRSTVDNGDYNPGALNIEFDIPFYSATAPSNEALLRIWGLGLQDIGSALDLAFDPNTGQPRVNIEISAGMSKGLPLANPKQQGLLLKGSIINAWGNWIGLEQTLDMTFVAGAVGSTAIDPKNFSFTWLSGTLLSTAIASTLATAMPDKKQRINISENLVLNHNQYGHYESLSQLATYINTITKTIIKTQGYPGVQIATDGDFVTVWDGTVQPDAKTVKKIEFQDMLGQPTWVNLAEVSLKVVLRGDLNIADVVSLPKALTTQTQGSLLQYKDKTAFTGNYIISQIHHFGNFRQPDAASWNTTINLVSQGFNPDATAAGSSTTPTVSA